MNRSRSVPGSIKKFPETSVSYEMVDDGKCSPQVGLKV